MPCHPWSTSPPLAARRLNRTEHLLEVGPDGVRNNVHPTCTCARSCQFLQHLPCLFFFFCGNWAQSTSIRFCLGLASLPPAPHLRKPGYYYVGGAAGPRLGAGTTASNCTGSTTTQPPELAPRLLVPPWRRAPPEPAFMFLMELAALLLFNSAWSGWGTLGRRYDSKLLVSVVTGRASHLTKAYPSNTFG